MLRLAFRPTCTAYRCRTSRLSARAFHLVTAEFVNLGPDGQPVSSQESVTVGDPHEAYVMVRPEIGREFQAANPTMVTMISPQLSAKVPLCFFHDTQHFAYGTVAALHLSRESSLTWGSILEDKPSFPRLVIPRDLPRQSGSNKSPATLWLYGKRHQITMDGTFDGNVRRQFYEMST